MRTRLKVTEGQVQSACLALLGLYPEIDVWRQNTGAAWLRTPGDCRGFRPVYFGVKGQADISGTIRQLYRGPKGTSFGVRLEIEVKSATGKLSPEQKEWRERTRKNGGIYLVARSSERLQEDLAELGLYPGRAHHA